MASTPRNPIKTTGRSRDEVYVAAIPLRATKGPAQLLMSAAYSLNFWHLQHFMLIIKPSTPITPLSNSQDPESIYVALAALSGKAVPGTILVREISKLPKKRCWQIGSSKANDTMEEANQFNSSWQTDLRIGQHDCRHYTNGLAEVLTGEENVLERLRSSHNS